MVLLQCARFLEIRENCYITKILEDPSAPKLFNKVKLCWVLSLVKCFTWCFQWEELFKYGSIQSIYVNLKFNMKS